MCNKKRPELWHNCDLLLHHNISIPISLQTTQFLTENYMIVTPQPLYLPDIATCDFTLCPKMKLKLNKHNFDTSDEIQMQSQW